jgi:uncharacterized protein YkwD
MTGGTGNPAFKEEGHMLAAAVRHLRRRMPAAAGVAVLALAVPQAAAASCPGADVNPNDQAISASASATLCLLNAERSDRGVRPLRENAKLDLAASRYARQMADRHVFAHGDFASRIKSARYLRGARAWTIGENIAWGSEDLATPAEIVDGWMHSPGHRANILSRDYREIGLGVATGAPVGGEQNAATYATDFGARG